MAKGRDAGGYDGRANLIPMSARSKNEAREMGRKGGINSGKARRKKADFRRVLNQILTMDIPDEETRKSLEALGLSGDMQTLLNSTMMKKALSGNVKAAEYIARYAGQSEQTPLDDWEQDARIDRTQAAADLDRAKTEAVKAQVLKAQETEEEPEETEDSFLSALMGTAGQDWEGTEDEKEN